MIFLWREKCTKKLLKIEAQAKHGFLMKRACKKTLKVYTFAAVSIFLLNFQHYIEKIILKILT